MHMGLEKQKKTNRAAAVALLESAPTYRYTGLLTIFHQSRQITYIVDWLCSVFQRLDCPDIFLKQLAFHWTNYPAVSWQETVQVWYSPRCPDCLLIKIMTVESTVLKLLSFKVIPVGSLIMWNNRFSILRLSKFLEFTFSFRKSLRRSWELWMSAGASYHICRSQSKFSKALTFDIMAWSLPESSDIASENVKFRIWLFIHGVIFLIFRHLCWGEEGKKSVQKNIILIILDTRLIWKSNLNWILMRRGGPK